MFVINNNNIKYNNNNVCVFKDQLEIEREESNRNRYLKEKQERKRFFKEQKELLDELIPKPTGRYI